MIPDNKLQEMLTAMAAAKKAGQISTEHLRKLRMELGISPSYFTKKRPTHDQRKAKRRAARLARRAQRSA